MTALALLVYTVAALGAGYIVGFSRISAPLRVRLAGNVYDDDGEPVVPWRYWTLSLLECPACLGWWIGLAAGTAWALTAGGPGAPWLPPLAGAFYTAGSNFLLARLTGLMPSPGK
jgi:hypothetical protein